MLAALNHPNIAAIYGIDEFEGNTTLILELVEGPTLADRVARGPVPTAEANGIARQVVDALDAAHNGIVHRDLKAANIKVRPDGTVKLLDFGLARALEPGSHVDVAESPTLTSPGLTHAGMILGTAAYMSPEQARGFATDKRTDIWAFGCVLFEMLAGRAAFPGATVSDTIVAILDREPDWAALPASMPDGLVQLLRRCLDKDRKRRLRDIGDAHSFLDAADASIRRPGPTYDGSESLAADALGSSCSHGHPRGVDRVVERALWGKDGPVRDGGAAVRARYDGCGIVDGARDLTRRNHGRLRLRSRGRRPAQSLAAAHSWWSTSSPDL